MIAVAKPETRHPTNLSGTRTNCRLPVGALSIGALAASAARILWPGFSPAFFSAPKGKGLLAPAGWEPGFPLRLAPGCCASRGDRAVSNWPQGQFTLSHYLIYFASWADAPSA